MKNLEAKDFLALMQM